jgi:hypothetical protein
MSHVLTHQSRLRTRGTRLSTPFHLHPILWGPSCITPQRPLQKSNYGGRVYQRESWRRTSLNVERAAMVAPPEPQADYPSAPTFSRRRNIQLTRLDKVSSLCVPTHPSHLPLIRGAFPNMDAEEPVSYRCRPYHHPLAIIRPQPHQLNHP